MNPICSCGTKVETTAHFLLHCPNYLLERKTLSENIKFVLPNISEQSDSFVNNVLLFGDACLDDSSNTIILNATINYIRSTKRFDPSNTIILNATISYVTSTKRYDFLLNENFIYFLVYFLNLVFFSFPRFNNF